MHKSYIDIMHKVGVSIQSKNTVINGHTIHYVKAGKGPVVVMVHGLNIGWGQWYKNIKSISQHFTVYCIDLPSSGRSSSVDLLRTDLQKNFIDVFAQFVNTIVKKNTHIIAHSIGAWIVLKAYYENKITPKSLVLICPVGFTTYMPWSQRILTIPYVAKLIATFPMSPTKKNLRSFFTGVMHKSSHIEDVFINYVHQNINNQIDRHPLLLISRLAGFIKIKDKFNLISHINDINIKTLSIFGEHDPLVPHLKATISMVSNQNIEVLLMKDTGHVPFIEEAKVFNKKIIAFLKKNN